MVAKRHEIEPGLLQTFRLFVGARLVLQWLSMCLWLVSTDERIQRFPVPGVVESALLMGYLAWPWLRQRLGKAYLPIALVVASAGPQIEYATTVAVRMMGGVPRNALAEDAWLLFVVLFIPLLLVSWQYSLRVVIGYVAGTTLLDTGLAVLLASRGGPRVEATMTLVLVRGVLFILVGYVVVRLMSAQRQQRAALAEANSKLASFASTLEQLATSQERNRLARELHDTLAHSLSAVAVQLEAVSALWDSDPASAKAMLDQSLNATRTGLHEARRAIQSLRASPLEELGLTEAIREVAESIAERGNLALEIDVPTSVNGLSPVVEQGVYRIAHEALANVAGHARATKIEIRLEQSRERLVLSIADDGQGFDPALTPAHGHFGLRGLYERAEVIGGKIDIRSKPGGGTTVLLTAEKNGRDSRIDM